MSDGCGNSGVYLKTKTKPEEEKKKKCARGRGREALTETVENLARSGCSRRIYPAGVQTGLMQRQTEETKGWSNKNDGPKTPPMAP